MSSLWYFLVFPSVFVVRLHLSLNLQIAGVTGVTGANALRPVAVGNNSGSDFATAPTAKDIASARGPERAHKRATAMRARMVPLFDDVFVGITRKTPWYSSGSMSYILPRLFSRGFTYSWWLNVLLPMLQQLLCSGNLEVSVRIKKFPPFLCVVSKTTTGLSKNLFTSILSSWRYFNSNSSVAM